MKRLLWLVMLGMIAAAVPRPAQAQDGGGSVSADTSAKKHKRHHHRHKNHHKGHLAQDRYPHQ
jgi:hypothetical protein